jgi:hypothetical protein
MKTALLEAFGEPLKLVNVPDPHAGAGEVVVNVLAAPVLSYAREVFDGTRNYSLLLPLERRLPDGAADLSRLGAAQVRRRRCSTVEPDSGDQPSKHVKGIRLNPHRRSSRPCWPRVIR